MNVRRRWRTVRSRSYAGGEHTHTETMNLPFDPTADFHDYAFFYNEGNITFYVDGDPMKEYAGGLPEEHMSST